MLSTVAMMFAPGWRKTMMRIAGLPFARPVVLTSSTESVTVAMSESRRAAPFLYETTSGSYWTALKSWSVAAMDQRRSPRPTSPFGRFVFTLARNVRTSSRPRPVRERGVGGIHLPVTGIVREVRGELAARRVDRGLDVPPGGVDVPRQVELERDRRRAEGALRRHLRDPRDPPELPLERRRDRRGHRLGALTGQVRRNRDRRELHLRERRHGEEEVRDAPRERERYGEEARAYRPADERSREAHRPPGAGSLTGPFGGASGA